MTISNSDAIHSMVRITSLLNLQEDKKAEYIKSVSEAVGWMYRERFDEVCKEVAKEMTSGRLPTPKTFIAIYNRLRAERHWDAADKLKKCAACQGTGFVRTKVVWSATGLEYDAVKHCPQCVRTVPELNLHVEVVEVTEVPTN